MRHRHPFDPVEIFGPFFIFPIGVVVFVTLMMLLAKWVFWLYEVLNLTHWLQ